MKKLIKTFLLLFIVAKSYGQSDFKINSFSHDIVEWDSTIEEYLTQNSFSIPTTLEFDLSGKKVIVKSSSKIETYEIIKEWKKGDNIVILTTYKDLNYEWTIPPKNRGLIVMSFNKDSKGIYLYNIHYYY